MSNSPIRLAVAVILDAQRRVLLVRKKGSKYLIQPGGKIESDERPIEMLRRGLHEALGVSFTSATRIGAFEDVAVNECGRVVQAEAHMIRINGTPRPGGEIEALAWVSQQGPWPEPVAPLSARGIFPVSDCDCRMHVCG